jgi:hypothetical protein
MPKPTKNSRHPQQPSRKIRIAEIRAKLPPALRLDPLGAGTWSEIESLQAGEALELPGRARDARRIGRAVARFARERGWDSPRLLIGRLRLRGAAQVALFTTE